MAGKRLDGVLVFLPILLLPGAPLDETVNALRMSSFSGLGPRAPMGKDSADRPLTLPASTLLAPGSKIVPTQLFPMRVRLTPVLGPLAMDLQGVCSRVCLFFILYILFFLGSYSQTLIPSFFFIPFLCIHS